MPLADRSASLLNHRPFPRPRGGNAASGPNRHLSRTTEQGPGPAPPAPCLCCAGRHRAQKKPEGRAAAAGRRPPQQLGGDRGERGPGQAAPPLPCLCVSLVTAAPVTSLPARRPGAGSGGGDGGAVGAAGRGGPGGAGRRHAGRAVAAPGRPLAALPAAAGARHAAAPLGRAQRPARHQLLPAAAGAPAAPPARSVRAAPAGTALPAPPSRAGPLPLSQAAALSPSRRAGYPAGRWGRACSAAGDNSGLVLQPLLLLWSPAGFAT